MSHALLSAAQPASLSKFALLLDGKAHLLSIGDEKLAKAALAAAKDVFDQGAANQKNGGIPS
jgi:U3 small nucleolar RNA-associated protein MPP10